jgi:SAM-dependent methyltransferase
MDIEEAHGPPVVDLRELPSEPFLRHPWELARARFFIDVIRSWTRGARPLTVLDVGAGDGYLGREVLGALPAGSRVVCFDPNYTAEELRRLSDGAPEGLTYSRECDVREADWLLLLDVMEHVADDSAFLSEFASHRLRPGGHALVSLPAWPMLFTDHDALLGHYRRYRPQEIDDLVARAGLERLDHGSLFASLLVPRSLTKLREHLRGQPSASPPASRVGRDDEPSLTGIAQWRGGRRLTEAVTWLLSQDARATLALRRRGIDVPGLSSWAVARRRMAQ